MQLMVGCGHRNVDLEEVDGGDNDCDDDGDGDGDNDDEEKTQASLDIFGSAVRAPTGEEARGDPDDHQHDHL